MPDQYFPQQSSYRAPINFRGGSGGDDGGDQTYTPVGSTSANPVTPPTMVGQYPISLIQALMQPGYLQGTSTVNPAFANYQGYNPTFSNAQTQLPPELMAALSPNQTIAQLQQSFQPQQQQANTNLNQMLANFGIGGGGAVKATEQLQGQLASSEAPALASAIQNAQGNILQGSEFGVNNALQQAMQNAGFANTAGSTNAQNALQAALANQSSANEAAKFNATGQNNMNAANIGEQNAYQKMLLEMIMGNYNATMGANANVVGSGQGAANQQAVNYGGTITTTPDPFATIFGAAASAAPFFGV